MNKNLLLILLFIHSMILQAQKPINELSWKQVAISMPDEWYGSEESIRVAENVLLYQRDAGGWPKNTDSQLTLDEAAREKILSEKSNSDAIFDNSATTTEMRFLAKMFEKTVNKAYRSSFNNGLKFILEAQYENGGWPMFYPLRKGYYTHITFNDNAIVNILTLLRDIATRKPPFQEIAYAGFYPRINRALDKGLEIILKTQIITDGKPTVWCAQHNEVTLLPAKARSYELPSFSGAESVGIVIFLMQVPHPSPEVIRAVEGAVAWLDGHRIKNVRWETFINNEGKKDRKLVHDEKAGDMWARFYDLETGEPYVCDRDGIKKKTLEEIGYERRNGYSWYTDEPLKVLREYPDWKKRNCKIISRR